jgi:protoheme IX farnesyltransferase
MADTVRLIAALFKLRIGFAIMLTALAGMAVTPGPMPAAWRVAILALAVLLSSGAAGAFNHYVERDIDTGMRRTRNRPFVTGRLRPGTEWLVGIGLLLLLSVASAALALNPAAAMYVFLGAFFYGVVYTIILKRRSWTNIVVGGLSGSFAVLAGAAAVDPGLAPEPLLLAIVLFLWTPPHFWSLAFVHQDDYRAVGVPMLPVVVGPRQAARIIFLHTLALVLISLVPFGYGLGWIYLLGALGGGLYFLMTSAALVRTPTIPAARRNFHASLIQLSVLLIAAIIDGMI